MEDVVTLSAVLDARELVSVVNHHVSLNRLSV